MQTKKTTRTARRAAQSLALAITLVGGATGARAVQQDAPSVTLVTKQGADVANAFAGSLAAWQLEALSGEASTEALKELRLQIQRAVREAPGDAALADVLVDAEAAWIARIAVAGAGPEREAALASLAAAVSLASRDGEADPLTAARARAAERPGVAALLAARVEANGASEPMTPAQTDIALSRAIDTALAAGDTAFVQGLGSLAVEPLRQLALASNGSPRPNGALSPLQALLDVDVRAGLDVAVTLVGRKDLLLKREVVAAINAANALDDDRAWTERLGAPDVILDERWLDLALGLVADPSVSVGSVRGMLTEALSRAALPPRLWELALESGVTNGGFKYSHPANRGYFELLIASEDPKKVEAGVRFFVDQEDATALYALVDTPIRDQIASRAFMSLGRRSCVAWTPGQAQPERLEVTPAIDAAYVDAFRRCLRAHPDKTDWFINSASQATFADPEQVLPVEALLEAAARGRASGSANLLNIFGYIRTCVGSAEVDLARAAIADAIGAGVDRDELGETLHALTADDFEVETFWAVRDVIDADEDLARSLDRYRASTAVSILSKDVSRLQDVLALLEAISTDPERASAMGSSFNIARSISRTLTLQAPDQLVPVMTRMAGWPDFILVRAITSGNGALEDAAANAVASAVLASTDAQSENRDEAARLLIAKGAAADDPEAVRRAAVELLVNGEPFGVSMADLARVGVDLTALVNEVLDREGVTGKDILWISVRRMGEPLARRIFERFPAASLEGLSQLDLVGDAAFSIYRSAAGDRIELLAPYVEASETVADRFLWDFGTRPDRAALTLVRPALETGVISDDTFEQVASAVSGLMTDESASLLLDLARQPGASPNRRRIAMEQFETMLQWREAAARWERSSGALARRDEAIARLVELLDSDAATTAQRVEAVRGLGLLGAAEELPRLIGLLGDDDLGAAAQGALDALHAKESGEGK